MKEHNYKMLHRTDGVLRAVKVIHKKYLQQLLKTKYILLF